MPLSLARAHAVAELAEHLVAYLPGTPHPHAHAAISFEGVARRLGLERYWSGGSKRPAVTQLLTLTLEHEPKRFCTLVRDVVQQGISYRRHKQAPLTRADIAALNGLVERVGFRIKELHAPDFLADLPLGPPSGPQMATSRGATMAQLNALQGSLTALARLAPSPRGFAFERLLNELFDLFGLAPRGSFRLRGEQIDGSFSLEGQTYLLEAKWTGEKVGEAPLLVLAGKVAGKAQWARGMFVSLAGFTAEGLDAFGRGKNTNLVCMDGLDLHTVLTGKASLPDLVAAKARRAVEEGTAFVSVRTLFPDVI